MHPDDMTPNRHDTLERICSQADIKKAFGPCPLCLVVEIKSTKQYCDHIGHHLEQLALFALPRTDIDGTEGKNKSDVEKDEGVFRAAQDKASSPTIGIDASGVENLPGHSREEDIPQAPRDQSSSIDISMNASVLGSLPERTTEEKVRDFEDFRRLPIVTGYRETMSQSDQAKWRWSCVSHSPSHGASYYYRLTANSLGQLQIQ